MVETTKKEPFAAIPESGNGRGWLSAAAFVATVLDGAPNICQAHEAARAVALTTGVYQSVGEGRIFHTEKE